ncbi:hypothetical protein ECDEC10F_1830 [Escherichia coli DEC10F]|nr:hypothetical protein ECDEC10F_1830 [Escherichia coli DEC10F]
MIGDKKKRVRADVGLTSAAGDEPTTAERGGRNELSTPG